jgi:hypothetical protein
MKKYIFAALITLCLVVIALFAWGGVQGRELVSDNELMLTVTPDPYPGMLYIEEHTYKQAIKHIYTSVYEGTPPTPTLEAYP